MERSFLNAGIGVAMTFVLGAFAVLSLGCGTIDANGFLGLETCDILNCDGLFFRNLGDDHDDMTGMDGMDDAEAHEDEGDEHMDDPEAHDDEGGEHMDDAEAHDDDGDGHADDDAEESENSRRR